MEFGCYERGDGVKAGFVSANAFEDGLAEKIVALTGSKSQIQYAIPRAGDIKHSRASVDKIQRCGYKAATSFREGLHKIIQTYHLIVP